MCPSRVGKVAPFRPGEGEREAVIAPWGEERKLLTAIRGGDRGAAEEIVERTYSAVFASLYRLCGDQDAFPVRVEDGRVLLRLEE